MNTLRRIAFRFNPLKPRWLRDAIAAWRLTGNKVAACEIVKKAGGVEPLSRAIALTHRIADAYPR